MIRSFSCVSVLALFVCCVLPLTAQHTASGDGVVPTMVKFTGTLHDPSGKPLTGIVGVPFLLYKEEVGGAPPWMETQNVHADQNGYYSVMLGASTSAGLPAESFAAGEARWLAVQPSGQGEQARVMLASVPYALKALDAQTPGGRPASAYVVASAAGNKANSQQAALTEQLNEIVCSSGTACKTGFVPLFSSNGGSARVTDSIASQSGSTLVISGGENVTGTVSATQVSANVASANGITGDSGGGGTNRRRVRPKHRFLGRQGSGGIRAGSPRLRSPRASDRHRRNRHGRQHGKFWRSGQIHLRDRTPRHHR
jgi:hypothetical protein